MQFPLIIAHRGDSANALENSLEAFRMALAVPADMIEFDLRLSRDGVLYVMHDKQTGRTADRDIDIETSTAKELSPVKLRNGENIPLLEDVLKMAAGRAAVNIEIKSAGAGAVLSGSLSKNPFPGPVMVSSFREDELQAVRKTIPEATVAVIYDTFTLRHLDEYHDKGYTAISLRKNTVTEPLVKGCHAHGVRIYVWTADEEEEMKRLIEWQVDGIYTNKPKLLKEIVSTRHASGM